MTQITSFEKSLPIFKEIQKLTNTVILRYPETVAISESGDVLLYVNFKGIGESEFEAIPLMDSLSSFTSVLELFGKDRVMDMDGSKITLSDGGSLKSTFITDNIVLMDDFDRSPKAFESTSGVPSVAEFELPIDDIKTLRKGTGVFKELTDLIVSCKDGDVSLSLGAVSSFNAGSNTFSKLYAGKGTKDFSIAIPVTNFGLIPLSDYNFMVKYNSAQNAYRIYLECSTLDSDLKIIMSIKI